MRKGTVTGIVIVIVVLLAGLGFGLPYYTGLQTEKHFRQTIEAALQDSPASIKDYQYKRDWFSARASSPLEIKAGEGHGATEAPRGMLYHRYRVDDQGYILDAQIAPPTAQNQMSMEMDLKRVLEESLDLPDDKLQWRLEHTIRNYDPCISCATHFLKVEIDRG